MGWGGQSLHESQYRPVQGQLKGARIRTTEDTKSVSEALRDCK